MIADDKHKDFAPKSKQKTSVNIVGGEDVSYGRLNDDLLTGFVWSRTHSTKGDSSTHRQATEGRCFTTIHAVTLSFPLRNPPPVRKKQGQYADHNRARNPKPWATRRPLTSSQQIRFDFSFAVGCWISHLNRTVDHESCNSPVCNHRLRSSATGGSRLQCVYVCELSEGGRVGPAEVIC